MKNNVSYNQFVKMESISKIVERATEYVFGMQETWRGCVAQWVACLTRNVEVVGSSPIKGPRCFLEQEKLPLLLSTGWFQEPIGVWFNNQTKINWGPYGRLT